MFDTVKFNNPPIVELILGVQFSPLSRMTTAHLGWFCRELGEDWSDLSEGPSLPDQFERFEPSNQPPVPRGFDWRPGSFSSMNRIAIGNHNQDRLLQVQTSQLRFH